MEPEAQDREVRLQQAEPVRPVQLVVLAALVERVLMAALVVQLGMPVTVALELPPVGAVVVLVLHLGMAVSMVALALPDK